MPLLISTPFARSSRLESEDLDVTPGLFSDSCGDFVANLPVLSRAECFLSRDEFESLDESLSTVVGTSLVVLVPIEALWGRILGAGYDSERCLLAGGA